MRTIDALDLGMTSLKSLRAKSILALACAASWTMAAACWMGCSSTSPTSGGGSSDSNDPNGDTSGSGGGPAADSGAPRKDAGPTPVDTINLPATCATPGMPGEIYALSAENLAGSEDVPMCDFRDDVILIVNTASFCGNTPQYAPLEALYEKYKSQGFFILGFPCNQFGEQEPGDAASISEFCTTEYHITFPMFAKIDVNGADQDPIYTWLKTQPGGAGDIDWNFAKFLVGRDGKFIKRWVASTQPNDPDVVSNIEAALAK